MISRLPNKFADIFNKKCKCRVILVNYTGESRLPGVAYTGESLGQPSRPANALKGTIPQKSSLGVLSTDYLEEILVLKIFLT